MAGNVFFNLWIPTFETKNDKDTMNYKPIPSHPPRLKQQNRQMETNKQTNRGRYTKYSYTAETVLRSPQKHPVLSPQTWL